MIKAALAEVLATLVCVGCTAAPTPRGADDTSSMTSLADPSSPTDATHVVEAGESLGALSMTAGRAAHTATTLDDGSVLVAGGCVLDGCTTATTDVFLVASDATTTRPMPAMSDARDAHTATLLDNGRVVLLGGFGGEGQQPSASIDVFDPASSTISEATASLATGRGGHSAAPVGDEVFVVGGWIRPSTYTSTVEIFDSSTGEVRAGAALPWAADSLDAIALHDGRILVTGGQTGSGVGTRRAAVYDAGTDAWIEVGLMSTPRFKHDTVLLDDGRVLVIGGTPDDDVLLSSTEVYDPVTHQFTAGPDMSEPRYKMPDGAVLLDDARVAIGGGGRTVEILDVATGESRIVDRFEQRGSFASVNLIGTDSLLVIGGYDDQIALRDETRLIQLSG